MMKATIATSEKAIILRMIKKQGKLQKIKSKLITKDEGMFHTCEETKEKRVPACASPAYAASVTGTRLLS